MSQTKTRINMRISESNLDLIREAASANGQDVTSFVLGSALERARTTLLEERITRLTPREAARLDSVLDDTSAAPEALRSLLRRTADQDMQAKRAVRS